MKQWMWVLLLISTVVANAQVISGKVVDATTQKPLEGVSISIVDAISGTASNSKGKFSIKNLETGRYQLLFTAIGYRPQELGDVYVQSGQIVSLEVSLNQETYDLDSLVIVDRPMLSVPGKVLITEEQINRFAATYYDPARLVTSVPDVAVTNDQNNRISVRGLSPDYNTWRLEGAEILNPNHLSNAGTFTDQPTGSGGGVNMLSAQMLRQSSFLYSNHESQYGNSLAGLFDMELKNGNEEQLQWVTQASLIGLDVAVDGPVSANNSATIAANYRYSFTGLLTNFGVDFGGESIGFQDLALSYYTPIGEQSDLKIFVVGGLSFNEFEHQPFADSERYKDRQNIEYSNRTGIIGARLNTSYSKMSASHTLTISALDNDYYSAYFDENEQQVWEQRDDTQDELWSEHSRLNFRLGKSQLSTGVMINRYKWKTENDDSMNDQWLFRPYADFRSSFNQKFHYSIGLGMSMIKDQQSLEPRINADWLLDAKHSIQLGAGRYSQLLNRNNYYFSNPFGSRVNLDQYDLQNSWRFTIGHTYEQSVDQLSISSELFYYYFDQANGYGLTADANTKGLTVQGEKSFSNSIYYRFGGSILDSQFDDSDHHYNIGYSANLSLGKSWNFSKATKKRSLSLNLRVIAQGGRQYGAYLTSFGSLITNYQTGDYLRGDLRVTWTKSKEGRTTTWALDLQNVSGRENEGFRYFDSFTNQVETQYQLGLIPILSWKVAW